MVRGCRKRMKGTNGWPSATNFLATTPTPSLTSGGLVGLTINCNASVAVRRVSKKTAKTSVRSTIVNAALRYEWAVGAGSRKAAHSALLYPRYSILFNVGLNYHYKLLTMQVNSSVHRRIKKCRQDTKSMRTVQRICIMQEEDNLKNSASYKFASYGFSCFQYSKPY
jgi:hypothetical protein